MKRIGVLGGISAQATMDFEARVHEVSQRLIEPQWNSGYPPLVVWYHRRLPLRLGEDGQPIEPREIDPALLDAAAWLGRTVDLIVIPCNAAHVGARQVAEAAGRPVLSMIDVTLDEVARRGWRRVGVLGFRSGPALYLDPLRARGVQCEAIAPGVQEGLDRGIRAVMEGRVADRDVGAARAAVGALRAAGAEGTVLGCTEIPLLLGPAAEAPDLLSPAALLAEAAVRAAAGIEAGAAAAAR